MRGLTDDLRRNLQFDAAEQTYKRINAPIDRYMEANALFSGPALVAHLGQRPPSRLALAAWSRLARDGTQAGICSS